MSRFENCNISVNNGKYRVRFQPCDYKYLQKSAFRYQLWPSFSRLVLNENASLFGIWVQVKSTFQISDFISMIIFWLYSSSNSLMSYSSGTVPHKLGRLIYSLKVFYFLLIDVDTCYLFLNWFSTCVSDNQKYLSGSRLYACINTRKLEGLDSREITSLPDIEKVIYTARHFNPRRK